MKRIICLLTVILLLITSFTSCGNKGDGGDSGDGSYDGASQGTNKSVYEKLGEMEFAGNGDFTVEVVTGDNGKQLTSTYNVKNENGGKSVSYTEESFSTFENVNGQFIIPDSYKTENSGSSFVKDGAVTVTGGSSSAANLKNISAPSFSFDRACFNNASDTGSTFTAEVTNIDRFLGANIFASNMSVTVSYGDKISSVVLNYKTDSQTSVTVTYTFG